MIWKACAHAELWLCDNMTRNNFEAALQYRSSQHGYAGPSQYPTHIKRIAKGSDMVPQQSDSWQKGRRPCCHHRAGPTPCLQQPLGSNQGRACCPQAALKPFMPHLALLRGAQRHPHPLEGLPLLRLLPCPMGRVAFLSQQCSSAAASLGATSMWQVSHGSQLPHSSATERLLFPTTEAQG